MAWSDVGGSYGISTSSFLRNFWNLKLAVLVHIPISNALEFPSFLGGGGDPLVYCYFKFFCFVFMIDTLSGMTGTLRIFIQISFMAKDFKYI